MTAGRIAVVLIVLAACAAGVGLWWTQTRAFWHPDRGAKVRLVSVGDAVAWPLEVTTVRAIRSTSSPLGFRACFTTPVPLARLRTTYATLRADQVAPTVPPPWFDCFKPDLIATGLANGQAQAFLGQSNIAFGVDRVVAIFNDGRGYAWHMLNGCGRMAYDGSIVGPACPDRETFKGAF